MKKLLFFFFVLAFLSNNAQDTIATNGAKKVINHLVYNSWKSVTNSVISNDGNWIAYEHFPQVGDGYVKLYNVSTQQTDSFARGKSPDFIYAGNGYLVFKIIPPYAVTRKAKLAKKKPDDMPKDTLAVVDLSTKKMMKLGNIKSYQLNEYSKIIIAQLNKEKKTPAKLSKREQRKRKKHPPIEVKSEGTALVLWDVAKSEQKKIQNVTDYCTSMKSDAYAYVVQQKGKNDSSFVYFNKKGQSAGQKVYEVNGWTKGLAIDEAGEQLAFLSTKDTNANNKTYQLFLQVKNEQQPKLILDTTNKQIDKKLTISENRKINFSPNGNHLFFGIAPLPKQEPKDTLTEDEKYNLDLWHWDDERIMTEQLKSLDKDKKTTFLSVYTIDKNDFTSIENDTLSVSQMIQKGNGDLFLINCEHPYRKSQSWETQVPSDFYTFNLSDKKYKLILTKKTHQVSLSYTGKYCVWYEPMKKDWFSMNLENNQSTIITNTIDDNLFEDNNGLAELPYPYGVMGWSKNDEYVYIYSEFEAWKVHPENKIPVICLTKNKGGEYNTDLRYVKTNKDLDYIDETSILFKSFNHHNKREGFWLYENGSVRPLFVEDKRITFLAKAKNTDKLIYTKMDFQTYPDIMINDTKFTNEQRVSNANPQQSAYLWGSVELVKWKTFEGHDLEGLLYKPENFDETKKYPMIVYYYEKNADNLHAHRTPRPSASIINPCEYVSNGYVVFVPDIVYKLGDPGKSAYDCIVSGTKYLIEKGFVNEKKIGLQGQSWGGYQTAFMVTQTNMFACGMAGAPVSNMTSAYGGVRWESGLVRAFQYEKGQSRIGKTLWEDREAYIRNSPLFFLDKVNTPLLMMNNDADGAVPWYQGIELYNGLRRLNKSAWLLNYNNDAHNLTKRANQMDLSIRMLQFFNHYLKDEPMPAWMKDGIPAINKGKVTGYELTK